VDWNLSCFEWTLGVLGLNRTVGFTSEYRRDYAPEEGADWRGKLTPRNREKWAAPRYRQVFEERIGFLTNLSILDLLFCEGKEAIRYIRSSDDGRPSATAAGAFPG
jgi:WbqC-like protein family